MTICQFTRPPLRAIEVRQVDTTDRWQGVFAGSDWTNEFVTTVAPLHLVLAAMKTRQQGYGLPVIVMSGYFEEIAA